MRYRLGLDIGIASCGWAIVRHDADGKPNGVEDLGVRLFEKAEKPDNGESLALARRIARGARRRIRRHQHRKLRAKYLFETYGLMTNAEIEKMYSKQLSDIYDVRVQALERCLNREEWVRLLMLWLQRRGYKSNSKSEANDNKSDSGKALKAIDENKKLMMEKGYRTVGEMLAKDEKFRLYEFRKTRNTSGDYKFTLSRSLIENEINIVFEKQKQFKNEFASDDFKKKYLYIFSSQRRYDRGPAFPSKYGGDLIEKMLGRCTFEKEEQRAPIASYTFEYFRLLQDINNISIVSKGGDKTKLEKEDRDELLKACKKSAEIAYKKVRELLKLDDDFYFGNLSYGGNDKEEVEKKEKLKGMKAYHEIRLALDKVRKNVINDFNNNQLDKIAYALTIKKDDEERKNLFKEANLQEIYYDALCGLNFNKVGNLSIKALKKISGYLEDGYTYDKACEQAGYDFRNLNKGERSKKLNIAKILEDYDIRNPVVKRAISQALKIINAIVEKYGSPDLVCIELSRDMSNNFEKRRKIEKAQEENRIKNEKAYSRVKEFKIKPSGEDIVKFKLWEEQQGICIYSGKPIIIERLFEDGYAEVDHIIPYSKSFDDSFSNKVLVFSKENQNKGNRLPLEYMKNDIAKRDAFIVRVNTSVRNYSKRIKLLKEKLTDADIGKFKERNLNDTKYATRLISTIIRENLLFNDAYSKNTVRSVNGNMTAYIRKRFGLEKNRELSNRHHALDAVVVACTTESYIKVITRFNQAVESIYNGESKLIDYETGEVFEKKDYIKDHINNLQLQPPWDRFREEVNARLSDNPAAELEKLKLSAVNMYDNKIVRPIFISYKPNRKVTGEAHKATILSGREDDHVIKKVTLDKLKLKDGEILNYYNREKDPVLYKLLRDKLIAAQSAEKEKDRVIKGEVFKPRKDGTNGPIVRSVKIIERSSANVSVREGGIAGNGDMVRIDIFKVENKGYYFVPIYVHNTIEDKLPNIAAPFKYKRIMDDKDFLFSIYYNDLIYFESDKKQNFIKKLKNAKCDDEEYDKGYFYYKTADIDSGRISVNTDHNNLQARISINGLKVLKKCEVDLLGNISFVKETGGRKAFNLKNKKRR